MLTAEARRLHYAGGEKQTTRVSDAGDHDPLGHAAGFRVSAGEPADGSACVLSRHGADMRFVCNERKWFVLPGPPAERDCRSRLS